MEKHRKFSFAAYTMEEAEAMGACFDDALTDEDVFNEDELAAMDAEAKLLLDAQVAAAMNTEAELSDDDGTKDTKDEKH